jgi:hypothetical protein
MARISLISPPGRIIQGSASVPELYNWDNGVKVGLRDKPQYFMSLMIDKTHAMSKPMLDSFWQQAHAFYGSSHNPAAKIVVANINKWIVRDSGFSWKVEDGDVPNLKNGITYPGSWIIKFSTLIPPAFCDVNNNTIDGSLIELGDYADVAFSIEGNGRFDRNAGLYVSQSHVRLLGKGVRITKQAAPAQVFGAAGQQMGDSAPSASSPPPQSAPMGNAYAQTVAPTTPQAYVATTSPTSQTSPASMSAPSAPVESSFPAIPLRGTPDVPNAPYPASDQDVPASAPSDVALTSPEAPSEVPLEGTVSRFNSAPSIPGFSHGAVTE